jgi:hypothetical protein
MNDFTPPAGFVDSPPPSVAGPEKLVSHTEEVTVERSLADVLACMDATPVDGWIDGSGALPGVRGTHVLAGDRFAAPGSRHMVFLTDGTSVVEQVLEKTDTPPSRRFRYVVWGYTTAAAKPLRYGVGDFLYSDLGGGRTNVRWTYSFELRGDRFPGFLGVGLGGALLKAAFLNGPYAKWMRGSLARIKANCEAWKG